MFTHGPTSITFYEPSITEDGNDLQITYTSWGDLYYWRVFLYSLNNERYEEVHNENGVISVEIDPYEFLG